MKRLRVKSAVMNPLEIPLRDEDITEMLQVHASSIENSPNVVTNSNEYEKLMRDYILPNIYLPKNPL